MFVCTKPGTNNGDAIPDVLAVIVNVDTVLPDGTVGTMHVTVVVPVQPPFDETNTWPAGNISMIVGVCAESGPAFEYENEYVTS